MNIEQRVELERRLALEPRGGATGSDRVFIENAILETRLESDDEELDDLLSLIDRPPVRAPNRRAAGSRMSDLHPPHDAGLEAFIDWYCGRRGLPAD